VLGEKFKKTKEKKAWKKKRKKLGKKSKFNREKISSKG
jgi:hypothetical protein